MLSKTAFLTAFEESQGPNITNCLFIVTLLNSFRPCHEQNTMHAVNGMHEWLYACNHTAKEIFGYACSYPNIQQRIDFYSAEEIKLIK